MAQVRYLGMVVGESDSETRDPRLGRYAAMSEPMPVGTALELDGATYRVTRVDEGEKSGCWMWPDGAAFAPLEDAPTVPTPPPVVEPVSPPAAAEDAAAVPQAAAPAAQAPAAESGPNSDEPGPGTKKRRKRSKTVSGR